MNQIVPAAATPLAPFERVRRELEAARTVDEIKDIRDKAEALRLYLKQAGESLEIQNAVAEIKLRAERRVGELLAEMEKNPGGQNEHESYLSHDVTGRGTMHRAPTLPELGVSRMQSHRWQQIAALPEAIFEDYLTESRESSAELTTAALLRLTKRWQRQQEPVPAESRPDSDHPANTGVYRLLQGDVLQRLAKLPARSVDCILTQPPPLDYAGSRSLYETLAGEAARLLYPGGSLILLAHPADLPETLALLTPHLRYHWTLVCLAPDGSAARRVPSRSLQTAWQPALWFTHGDYRSRNWIGDVFYPVEKKDDAFRSWAQSEHSLMHLLESLSNPGDLVLDPFMGEGAVGAAALRLRRRFVGIGSDAQAVAMAAERLSSIE